MVSIRNIAESRRAMTGTSNGSGLNWEALAKNRDSVTRGPPPGTEALQWVANTVTLIYGDRDAVLVDTFLPAQHNHELAGWIAASGKKLTAVAFRNRGEHPRSITWSVSPSAVRHSSSVSILGRKCKERGKSWHEEAGHPRDGIAGAFDELY